MSYSRRDVLRDAAVLAAGAALGGAGMYFRRSSKAPKLLAATAYAGIRVVFAGSWLFCADANGTNGQMRAMTLETTPGDHQFPFGRWRVPGFDAVSGNLRETRSSKSSPYVLALPQYTPKFGNVDQLFLQSLKSALGITYLQNPNQSPVLDDTSGVRTISLPIPESIITAAFLPGTKVTGNNLQSTDSEYSAGVATVQIFNYPMASNLTFTDPVDGQVDAAATGDHFHFHTVPVVANSHTPNDMFKNLQRLLSATTLLTMTGGDNPKPPVQGDNLPDDLCKEELDMGGVPCVGVNKQTAVVFTDTASCAGGGIGYGNGCSSGTAC